jgi:hypothetical protein
MLSAPRLVPPLAHLPVPPPRAGWLNRLAIQIAGSAWFTVFYTPGGAAGWALDLLFRSYAGVARRLALPRLVPLLAWHHRTHPLGRTVGK